MQVKLRQLIVPPGKQLLITDVSWLMYEQLLEELGKSVVRGLITVSESWKSWYPYPNMNLTKLSFSWFPFD